MFILMDSNPKRNETEERGALLTDLNNTEPTTKEPSHRLHNSINFKLIVVFFVKYVDILGEKCRREVNKTVWL